MFASHSSQGSERFTDLSSGPARLWRAYPPCFWRAWSHIIS